MPTTEAQSLLCFTSKDDRRVAALNGMTIAQWDCLLVRRCTQFDSCSAVDCPLDFRQGQRSDPYPDESEKCRALVSTRQEIIAQAVAEGLKFELHYGGLTYKESVSEIQGERRKARYEALPEDKKQEMRERLVRARAVRAQAAETAHEGGAGASSGDAAFGAETVPGEEKYPQFLSPGAEFSEDASTSGRLAL